MLDLHTHILFGVDDGAKTLDDAMRLIRKAHDMGVKTLVLTPHVSFYRTFKSTQDLMTKNFHTLKEEVVKQNLSIELLLGAEIDEHDHILSTLKQGYTIDGTSYVLVDFSMRKSDIDDVLYDLRHSGYKVIMAHPERISYVSYADLLQFKADGALFQVSSYHLLPLKFDRASRMAKRLLKHDLIDFVASDVHHVDMYDSFLRSYYYVEKKKGVAYAEKLYVSNPAKIIGRSE